MWTSVSPYPPAAHPAEPHPAAAHSVALLAPLRVEVLSELRLVRAVAVREPVRVQQ